MKLTKKVPEEAIQETETSKIEEIEEQPKPKAKPKKLERSVKIDELVECSDYNKKNILILIIIKDNRQKHYL